MGQVPNTNTFSLQDVCTAIYGSYSSGMNLVQCFTDATGTFDPTYVGSKNSLLNFRNYVQNSPLSICKIILVYVEDTYHHYWHYYARTVDKMLVTSTVKITGIQIIGTDGIFYIENDLTINPNESILNDGYAYSNGESSKVPWATAAPNTLASYTITPTSDSNYTYVLTGIRFN